MPLAHDLEDDIAREVIRPSIGRDTSVDPRLRSTTELHYLRGVKRCASAVSVRGVATLKFGRKWVTAAGKRNPSGSSGTATNSTMSLSCMIG